MIQLLLWMGIEPWLFPKSHEGRSSEGLLYSPRMSSEIIPASSEPFAPRASSSSPPLLLPFFSYSGCMRPDDLFTLHPSAINFLSRCTHIFSLGRKRGWAEGIVNVATSWEYSGSRLQRQPLDSLEWHLDDSFNKINLMKEKMIVTTKSPPSHFLGCYCTRKPL